MLPLSGMGKIVLTDCTPGRPFKFRQHLIEESLRVVGAWITGRGQSDVGGEEPRGLQSGINPAKAREALHEEASAGEQNQSERDFRDDENAAQAMMDGAASARAASAFVQGGLEIEARGLESRREAEEDASGERDGEGKREHHSIESNLGDAGNVLRHERNQDVRAPGSEKKATQTAEGGKHDTLDQELANDAAPAGSKRGAKSDFFCPHGGAGEKEIGHVGARDQKHAGDGAEKDVERAGNIADQLLLEREDGEAGGGV